MDICISEPSETDVSRTASASKSNNGVIGDASVAANLDTPESLPNQSNHEQSVDQPTVELNPTAERVLTAPQHQSSRSQQ